MEQKKIPLDENAKQLIKKCEDKEIATQGMGTCQVFLEEIGRGNVVLDDESGQSYIKKSKEKSEGKGVTKEDVPNIVRIAFIVRDSDDIVDRKVKGAASRLIRRIELI